MLVGIQAEIIKWKMVFLPGWPLGRAFTIPFSLSLSLFIPYKWLHHLSQCMTSARHPMNTIFYVGETNPYPSLCNTLSILVGSRQDQISTRISETRIQINSQFCPKPGLEIAFKTQWRVCQGKSCDFDAFGPCLRLGQSHNQDQC